MPVPETTATDDLDLLVRQKQEQAELVLYQAQRDGKAWDPVKHRWIVWNAKEHRLENPE